MGIPSLTSKEQYLIVRNVLAACKDITKLNKRGYDFLCSASGLIAHYDIGGFIDHYSYESLHDDILRHRFSNQSFNFRLGEENYEYYMSRRQVYNSICSVLEAQR